MCNSFNKKQQRLRDRRRASRDRGGHKRRRTMLIARCVEMTRFVLSELDLNEESGPRLRVGCYYCGGGCLHGQPCPGL